ncbi:MAG: TMEM175 family protein [Bacteroidota bacterium]|nr:TMEM175 family protein [Bacteroidota bacterium]
MSFFKDESILPKNRLENLCDGIFAVTMTLMILELKTPQNIPQNLEAQELPDALLSLWPIAEAYVLSFIILGIFWLRHQVQFKYLKCVNIVILSTNIFFLLLTGFVPFSVEMMKQYPDYNLPFMIYDINLLLMSILLYFQWYYISNNDNIIEDNVLPEMKKKLLDLSLVPIIIFTASFAISFFNTRIAFFIVYLLPLFYLLYSRFSKKIS